MSFKDHFSGHADIYRQARPHYPAQLFAWLARLAPANTQAWDCGCGNGQATVALASHFRHVIGTDPSAAQIANAAVHANVEYRVESGEQSSLQNASVDLVTVAQALHWLDLDRFYNEVRRVLKPHGVIAVWTYADCCVDSAIDAIKNRLYEDVLGEYWPPERRLVEAGYATLAFPFIEVETEKFDMLAKWDAQQFLAYLRSWSATQRYRKAIGTDPVALVEEELLAVWGDPLIKREVRWKLAMRVGRI